MSELVFRGGTLVTARVDEERADSANAILQGAQGVDIKARREEYATEGWERFDDTSEPYVPATGVIPPAGIGRI